MKKNALRVIALVLVAGMLFAFASCTQEIHVRFVDKDGNEYEFLSDYLEDIHEAYSFVFLKGYQWPFSCGRAKESSQIDFAVHSETSKGRRVYLDFTRNPDGFSFDALSDEARDYLEKNGFIICESKSVKRYKSPLFLTEKGAVVGKKIADKIDGVLNEIGVGLSDEERNEFYRCLTIISDKIDVIANQNNM